MKAPRFSLKVVFLGMTIACLAAWWWLSPGPVVLREEPSMQIDERSFRKAVNDLRSAAQTLHYFSSNCGVLPVKSTGEYPISWRVGSEIFSCPGEPSLPNEDAATYDMDRAWYDPSNAEFDNENYRRFCFDSSALNPKEKHYTNILAITGEDTAFSFGNLTDVPPDCILLVEVSRKLKCQWMEPFDFDVDKMSKTIGKPHGICGNYGDGFLIVFADMEVWYLKNSTPFVELEKFFTISSAGRWDREQVLGAHVIAKWDGFVHHDLAMPTNASKP